VQPTFTETYTFYVTSNDGNVVRGQTFNVTTQLFNTSPEPMQVTQVSLNVPPGWTATASGDQPGTLAPGQGAAIAYAVTVGPSARYTQPYWKTRPGVDRYDIEIPEHHTLPWSPPDVTATVNYTAAGAPATVTLPAYFRYDGPWVGGEKQKIVRGPIRVRGSAGRRGRHARRAGHGGSSASPSPTTPGLKARRRAPQAPAGWSVQLMTRTLTFGVEEEVTWFFVLRPRGSPAGRVRS
jgi:hypothetical protein